MQKNKFRLSVLAGLAMIGVSGAALAQQAAPDAQAIAALNAAQQQAPTVVSPGVVSSGTAAEISRLNEQIAILRAQLSKIELQGKIAKQESEIVSARKAADPTLNPVPESPPPVVRSIEGSNGKLSAVLAFSSGETAVATPGASLSGGWKVISIKESSVVMKHPRTGQSVTLNFGYAPAAQSYQPSIQSAQGLGTPR